MVPMGGWGEFCACAGRLCVRVSMGHVLHVPFARFEKWPQPIDLLRAAGFMVAALTPATDAIPIDDFHAERVAWLLGAEGAGLTDEALARARQKAQQPVHGPSHPRL